MHDTASLIPILENDLVGYVKRAEGELQVIPWRPKRTPASAGTSAAGFAPSLAIGEAPEEKASIVKAVYSFCDNEIVPTDALHHVLWALKRGLQVGAHLENLYAKAAGLEELERQAKGAKLPEAFQAEFSAKQATRAAVSLWVTASYVAWDLSGFQVEEVSSVSMEEPSILECPLDSAVRARRAALYYLAKGLESDAIATDIAFVKYTLLYFRALMKEMQLRIEQLQHVEPFTSRKYKLYDSEFVVDGFKQQGDRSVVSVEFNRVRFDEIVGNKIAKHQSRRGVMRLLCFDTTVRKNPMQELGGLASITLGYGEPGTGKSMLIAAKATELDERTKWLKIPFLFHPLPDAIVSTYQGGSAERMVAWMSALRDPTKIIYAPIDDAENNLEERTRQGVSAGVREVIAVFLRNTEGAYAVNHGNTLIDVCTNLPEQVDKAVMSRIVERYPIRGAETAHDSIDQDRKWWEKYESLDRGFINMKDPKDYEYFADQKPMKSISSDGERYPAPKVTRIREVYERTLQQHDPAHHAFFGALFENVKRLYPGFTSRDKRNIQSAVTSRILDFDFPAEWLDDPAHFFARPYDEKKGMLVELLKSNMKGASFRDIRLEEWFRYLDNMASVADTDFERQIKRRMDEMRIHMEAQRRLNAA